MGTRRKLQTRDDVYSRPSFLPNTIYADCQSPERSLQALMGLNDDVERMRGYVETMNICATRHLDATERYFHHPKQAMERYLRSVSRHVDIMDAYEDAWPAQAYARIWLNWGTKARHERARRRTTSTVRGTNAPRSTPQSKSNHGKENKIPRSKTPVPEDTQPKSSQTVDTADTAPSATGTSATQTSTRATSSDTRSQTICSRTFQRTPPPNQLGRQLSNSPQGRPQHTNQLPSSAPGPSGSRAQHNSGSAASVGAFLHSLAQPLDHLLPVFYEVGVRDAGSLLGLARLRNRGDWLYVLVVDRKITPLEYKFIADGLDDLDQVKHE